MGIVQSVEVSNSGSERVWNIVFADCYYYLEHCFALVNEWQPTFKLFKVAKQAANAQGDVVQKISVSAAFKAVLSLAKHHQADYELRIADNKMLIPWSASCDTVGSLIASIRRWCPRMVSFYDYSGERPKLVITDYDSQEPLILPLQPTEEIKGMSVSLSDRKDLVPPCVAVVAESSGSTGNRASYFSIYPPGSDPTLPHALIYRTSADFYMSNKDEDGNDVEDPVPVQSTAMNSNAYQRMRGKGREIDRDHMIDSFWKYHFPWMEELLTLGAISIWGQEVVERLEWDGLEEDRPRGYYTDDDRATAYELIEGQIHTKSIHPLWCRTKITQKIIIPANAPPEWQSKFKNIGTDNGATFRWQEFVAELITIDRPNFSYPIDGQYNGDQPSNEQESTEEEEPAEGEPYAEVARAVWESMQQVPVDGSITFHALGAASSRQYMGRKVSIIGGNPAWENIDTMVQSVSHDLQTGVISLSYGAPSHLSIDELLQLRRTNEKLQQSANIDATPGSPASGNGDGGKKPESPTVSQNVKLSEGGTDAPVKVGFQVNLEKDSQNRVINSNIEPGNLYLNGECLGSYPAQSAKQLNQIDGEVWMNVYFDKDAKFKNVELTSIPVTIYPIQLNGGGQDPVTGGFTYAFHIATIANNAVTQYAYGMIQIPVHGGTLYPYGPA